MSGPQRLGDLMGDALPGPGAGRHALAALVAEWPRLVGEQLAQRAWPASVAADGALVIACVDSTWANELSLLEPELRARLSVVGRDVQLRFRVGRVPPPAVVEPAVVPPSPAVEAAASEVAAAVVDDELRHAFEAFARRALSVRERGLAAGSDTPAC